MSTREGWLDKKSVFGMWSKKYFVLINSTLTINKVPSSTIPETSYQLDSQTTVETVGTNNSTFKIVIQKPKVISLILRASSTNEMMDWMFHLRCSAFANKAMYMSMFNIISVLGCGFYGKVMLCEKKDSKEIVAIKSVRKNKLIKSNKVESIFNERTILTSIHNPFIISLKYAFQTNKKYYMALEFEPGGDLFHRLKFGPPPSLQDIKLYISELSIAINELHNNNIIYRDVKPENVMIDKDGHLKLADFGLSCFFKPNETIKTVCGTPEYIAPEMISGEGYGRKIDWWGIGLLTYELLYRSTPFTGMNNLYIYQSILKKDPVFPKDADPAVVNFISTLLQKDPLKRGGFRFIVHSDFMSDINFQEVYDKKISPSYIPNLSSNKDISYFDSKFTKAKPRDSDSESDEQLDLGNCNTSGFSFYGTNDNLKLNESAYILNYSSSKLISSQSTIYQAEDSFLTNEKSKSDDN